MQKARAKSHCINKAKLGQQERDSRSRQAFLQELDS